MSHSKRNTSRAVFTSHERALAKANWSSKSARLNRDSFLPFGSCGLCLEMAREPVSCQLGDIFCRECVLTNLLAQKKELKRAGKLRLEKEAENARAKAALENEDQQRTVLDFELTQAGLSTSKGTSRGNVASSIAVLEDKDHKTPLAGSKRKLTLDEVELSRIAKDDRQKARRAIDGEKAEKPILPSFWTPSLTPSVNDQDYPDVNKKIKLAPTCPVATDVTMHTLSMQKLITMRLQEDTGQSDQTKRWVCPSCLKTLTNSSSPVMAQQCGHVVCLNCIKKFVVPSQNKKGDAQEEPILCHVCDAPVGGEIMRQGSTDVKLPAGLILLKSEGTGFSARGSNTVEKLGVEFQC